MAQITGGLKKANSGFRKTSAGVKLGKLIFDPATQANISPALITSLLRQAGIQVPKEAAVTLASAQLIMSGGALVNGIEEGRSIAQLSGVGLNVGRATLSLLEECGLMKSDTPPAMMLQTAFDGALVISSGGLNILADIAFVLDLFADFARAFGIGGPSSEELYQAEMARAQSRCNAQYNAIVSPEAKAASAIFEAYHNGQVSVFTMLGKVAEAAPDLFPTYFPAQGVFFPQATKSAVSMLDIGNLNLWKIMDLVKSGMPLYAVKEWQGLSDTSKATVQWSIAKAMLQPLIDKFRVQSVQGSKFGLVSVIDISVLSMIPKFFEKVGPGFDIVPILKNLALSPNDMGYDLSKTKQKIRTEESNVQIQRTFHEAAITLNGVDFIRPGVPGSDHLLPINKVKALEVEKIMKTWGQWSTPFNVRDFWAIVSMSESMQKDPYFKDAVQTGVKDQIDQILVSQFGDYGSHITEKHRDLQFLSVARRLNFRAKMNIADFFGVPVGKLKLAPLESGQVTKVLH